MKTKKKDLQVAFTNLKSIVDLIGKRILIYAMKLIFNFLKLKHFLVERINTKLGNQLQPTSTARPAIGGGLREVQPADDKIQGYVNVVNKAACMNCFKRENKN